jgi:hypothetical protein
LPLRSCDNLSLRGICKVCHKWYSSHWSWGPVIIFPYYLSRHKNTFACMSGIESTPSSTLDQRIREGEQRLQMTLTHSEALLNCCCSICNVLSLKPRHSETLHSRNLVVGQKCDQHFSTFYYLFKVHAIKLHFGRCWS